MSQQISKELKAILDEELKDLTHVLAISNLNMKRLGVLLSESARLVDMDVEKSTAEILRQGGNLEDNAHLTAKAKKFEVYLDDIGRAMIVFLHSAVETTLRDIIRLKLKQIDADLSGVPFDEPSGLPSRKDKITLIDLARYRGQSVDAIIEASINEYLARLSFNNANDIAANLKRIGLSQDSIQQYYMALDEMMKRRHKIVHEGDIKPLSSEIEPIDLVKLKMWLVASKEFSREIINVANQTFCLDKIMKRIENSGIVIDRTAVSHLISISDITDTQVASKGDLAK